MTTAGIFLLPNGTFFIELIVSIILILAIYKWVLPPINKAMEERQEKIRESLEAADKARADAEAADDERRNVLEEARHQAREIVATANRTADQVRTDATARGQSEYERIVGNAEVEISLARQRAVEEAAAKLTVKLLFPLVFFIFPALFIVVLGPAIISIMAVFGNMH